MINSNLQTQENIHITTINNERDIEEDGNWSSYIVKLISREEKRSGLNFREQVQRNAHCIALLFNVFFSLLIIIHLL